MRAGGLWSSVTCTATWGFPRTRGGHGKPGNTAAIRLTPPCECRGQEGPGPQQGKGKGWSLVLTGSPESPLRSQMQAFLVLSSTLKRMYVLACLHRKEAQVNILFKP